MAQIILNGFEAFVVKHGKKKRHAIEMHASLFGYREENRQSIRHNVQFMSVDTSAEMRGGEVLPRPEAVPLKKTMAAAMGFSLLADFHTHPYLAHEIHLEGMRKRGGRFSREDDGDFGVFKNTLEESKEPYLLAGILGIRNKNQCEDDKALRLERLSSKRDGFISENLFEFTIADCKCFLHFQAFELDAEKELYEIPTAIKCEYLESFSYLGSDFGRATVVKGKQRIVEHRT